MALNYEKLLAWSKMREIDVSDHTCILYALGVGLGSDPVDEKQLTFLNERNLAALPTMAMVHGVGPDYLYDPEYGVDMVRMLHGESGLELHKPLPVSGKLRAEGKIDAVIDRGEAKGAATYFSTKIYEVATEEHIATTSGCFVMRGNGGFGGPDGPSPKPHNVPDREPDLTCDIPTMPQAGLIYRLSGDRNPLHVDPKIATRAGFERPILHGLATFGVAGHGILKLLCDYDASKFKKMKLRYSSPVYPGETVRVQLFEEAQGQYAMRCIAVERAKVVLNNGYIEVEK